MTHRPPVHVAFALAVLDLEGVGHVTAHRLLERFPTYPSLLAFPREQVLLRLKGAPNAERTVGRLFDQEVFAKALRKATEEVKSLAQKHVDVIAAGHPYWPAGVADLKRSNRPVVLYAFGSTEALAQTSVALHARPPLPGEAFEAAQALARKLIIEGIPVVCGAQTGFDVVIHKLCSASNSRCVMVARSGLAKVDNQVRPSAAAAVKAGGVLVSPFPASHGPFDHDDAERVLLQAALAGPNVFIAPKNHIPEVHAIEWALAARRPVFAIAGDGAENAYEPPNGVHTIARPIDQDWVIAAAKTKLST